MQTRGKGLMTAVLILGLAAPAAAQDPATAEPEEVKEPVEVRDPATAIEETIPGDQRGTFSIQVENDLFASGTDRNYTNGLRASWLSPEGDVPDWLKKAVTVVPWYDGTGRLRHSFTFGQNMYTPDDLQRTDVIADERPYAGWLYAGVGLTSDTGRQLDTLELDIGVIGPYSLAEDTQKFWHSVIDAPEPLGWDNQLRTEPGVLLIYERKWRSICNLDIPQMVRDDTWGEPCSYNVVGLAADATPHVGLALGNVHTHAAAGITFRLGQDLPSDYGPPRIRPSLPGSDFFKPNRGFGWYLFAGAEGRAVARNIFLDGNTFRDSHSVDKEIFVADFQAGIALTFGRTRLSYTYVYRTAEYEQQDRADQFGSVNVSFRF